jgi:dTDP-glucose pyrophosphorylase
MKNADWQKILMRPDTPLSETIVQVDASALQVALVTDDNGKLLGVVTDGDIRRAILRRVTLESPTSSVMNSSPKVLPSHSTRNEILLSMRRHAIRHMPLVDGAGIVVDLAILDDLIGSREQESWVVLMAGGFGTRLRPLTDSVPKPLLPVGGRPIMENIVVELVEQGFRRIFVSVNYKAALIKKYFGDGSRWNVSIEYLHETVPLGTAGALSLLPERPQVPLLIMNSDLLTKANLVNLLEFHQDHHAVATMAVREYDIQVPFGVVKLDGESILGIEEKPIQRVFVNAGMYALAPEALGFIQPCSPLDMPSLFENLIARGQKTTAYHLREYWIDIGRLEELERAQDEWAR